MAGYGTKKPGGDAAIEMTFPTVYERLVRPDYQFYPQLPGPRVDVMSGADFQSRYHEDKRREANQRVLNGLQARRTQAQLLLTGHQNYHLPAPVLSQRRFANPSFGATGFSSARQDGTSAPFQLVDQSLVGGVLRTAEGQGYIQRKRMERIDQLNRIDALASGQPVESAPPRAQREPETVTESLKIEFNLLRQSLIDDLVVGVVNRFSYENGKRMLDILFRYAPRADRTEMEDILSGFDTIVIQTRALLDSEPQDELRRNQEPSVMETLEMLMTRAREYTVEMIRGRNRSLPERLALSKALIRTLGFSTLFRGRAYEALEAARRRGVMTQRERQEDEDDDDNDGGGDPYPRGRAREDDEQEGVERQPLAGVGFDENQARFGERSGRYLSDGGGEEEAPAYFEPFAPAPSETTPELLMDRRSILLDLLRLPPDAPDDAIAQVIDAEWGGREEELEEEVDRRVNEARARMGPPSSSSAAPLRPTAPSFIPPPRASRLRPEAPEFVRSIPKSVFKKRTETLEKAKEFAKELGVNTRTENLANLRRYLLYQVLPAQQIRLTDE